MDLSYFFSSLREFEVFSTVASPDIQRITAVDFLKKGTAVEEGIIYLCTAGELAQLHTEDVPDRAIFCVYDWVDDVDRSSFAGRNVIVCSCDMKRAYSCINEALTKLNYWNTAMLEARCAGTYADKLLALGSKWTGAKLYLLNAGGQLLAEAGDSAHGGGGMVLLNLEELYSQAPCGGGCVRINNTRLNTCRIIKRLQGGCYLAAACSLSRQEEVCALLECMAAPVNHAIEANRVLSLNMEANFSLALGEVLDGRIHDERDVRDALFPERCSDENYYRLAVIAFEENKPQNEYSCVISAIISHMPNVKIAVYNNQIVMMYLLRDREVYDTEATCDCFAGNTPEVQWIKKVLEEHNARACTSESCSHFDRVLMHYELCCNSIRLTRQRRNRRERRWTSTMECNTLNLVDYAAKYFKQFHGNSDIIYLARSEAIHLMQYDKEKNSNLSQVLFSYLMNNCKIDQTAKKMYMHRNTVINKLNRIRKITHLDLDDSNIQLDLMISILVLEHYQQTLAQTFAFNKMDDGT